MTRDQLAALQRALGPGFDTLAETHISWVLLGPDDVYKIKRPVALGFLDFSRLEAREEACAREVALNRRLAPDVYLGVVPITLRADGTPQLGGGGPRIDFAVHMKRLADSDRADVRLEDDALGPAEIRLLAAHLARFHAALGPAPAELAAYGDHAGVVTNVRENFAQTEGKLAAFVDPGQAAAIERWQLEFLAHHRDRFAARTRAGRVRDGHGDLRLEHVYLHDRGEGPPDVTVLDCIEFTDRFRVADVASDVAFLAMDLAAHRRVDLAELLLAEYARESDDHDLYAVVDFYESYRAFVRAKVAAVLAHDPEASPASRARAGEAARTHLLLAMAADRKSLLAPRIVAIGGIIASGKSTVAEALGERLGAPVLASDRLRKAILGADATTRLRGEAWDGAYAPETTATVYEEMLRRARVIVGSGRPVVLDASFRTRAARAEAAALARTLGVPFTFFECRVDEATARDRLRARARGPSVSDAREDLYDAFVASWEPTTELAPDQHRILHTAAPWAEVVRTLASSVDLWPRGLRG